MKDDLLDYADTIQTGKPVGIDIKEKKLTLPVIYALNNADKSTKSWMINAIKNHNTDKVIVAKVIAFVVKSGGIEYTVKKMEQIVEEAKSILRQVGTSNTSSSLEALVDFSINRSK
jgi:octaprenyl-diphosphate synthase